MLAYADGKPIECCGVHGQTIWTRFGSTEIPTWDFENIQYRPFTWKLPEPPAGKRWHRDDFQEEDLPEGFRPLMKGEVPLTGDEWRSDRGWLKQTPETDNTELASYHTKHRTRRPLPAAPRMVPWDSPEELPALPIQVRWKNQPHHRTFIAAACADCIWVGGATAGIGFKKAFDDLETLDGKPFGKEVK